MDLVKPSVHSGFLGFWFLGGLFCLGFTFRTGFKRGIVNYPFGFEDCAEERTSYLIGVISVTCKLGVSGAEQLQSCSESPLLHDCSASGFWFWFGLFCFGETRRTEGGVKCIHRNTPSCNDSPMVFPGTLIRSLFVKISLGRPSHS